MKKRLTFIMLLLLPASLVSCKTEMPPETEQVQSSIIETSEITSATTETTTIEETIDESSIVHEYDALPVEWNSDVQNDFLYFFDEYIPITIFSECSFGAPYDFANEYLNEFLISRGYADQFGYYDIYNLDMYSRFNGVYNIRNFDELFVTMSFGSSHSTMDYSTISSEFLFNSAYAMNTLRLNNIQLGDYMPNEFINLSTYDIRSESSNQFETQEAVSQWMDFNEHDDITDIETYNRNYLMREYNVSIYNLSCGQTNLQGKPLTWDQEYIERLNCYLEENGYVYRFGEQVTWAQIGYQESIERGLNAEYNRELDQYTIDGVVQTYEDYCANYFNEADYVNEIEAAAICQENTVMYPHGPVVINEERVNDLIGG